MREEYLRSRNTRDAVTAGLTRTARVITAAAAILVDATVIRMVLVPAVMQLLGRANWWMPRWLARVVPEM